MAGRDYGGRITLRLSTGETFALRGTMTLMPARHSAEAVTAYNGDVDRTLTPQPSRAEIVFADKGIDYDAIMRAPRFNATFVEETTAVQHYFTSAFVTGDPSINRLNGEVSGFTFSAEQYKRVAS